METKVLHIRSGRVTDHRLSEFVRWMKEGRVVAFPTDTVYGLGTSAFSAEGMSAIYRLKGRQASKPLPVLVESLKQAETLVSYWPSETRVLAEKFWPGPLTLILQASELGRMLTGGKTTIGVRIPKHPIPLRLIRLGGFPIASTSANASGKPAAVRGCQVLSLFGGRVSGILDAGRLSLGKESTILDGTASPPRLLRPGALSAKELSRVL